MCCMPVAGGDVGGMVTHWRSLVCCGDFFVDFFFYNTVSFLPYFIDTGRKKGHGRDI